MTATAVQSRGASAAGALAVGALAIRRVAIERLGVRDTRLGRVEIDELVVHRLRVVDLPVERDLSVRHVPSPASPPG
jgi:hypothetical protein